MNFAMEKAAAGSGLPEFKSLLAGSDLKNSDYEKLVSRRIFLTKIFGLVFSVGSGLSCGTEGPLVHVSACVAHLLMKYVHEFELILDSPSVVKQIFAASVRISMDLHIMLIYIVYTITIERIDF